MVETFLTEDLGIESRTSNPGHSQRGGPPVAYDRLISTLQGVEAVKAVLEATPDSETNYIAIVENKIVRKPLMKAVQDTKDAAKAIAEKKFDLAMSLRDSEFEEQYKSFHITTNVIVPEDEKLPIKDRMRIGLINVGAPAGGVNAALRAATAYCLRQGHTPIAIYNGFTGFVRHHADKPLGSVRELEWAEVDEWAANGGSQIGTNRHLPDDSDVGMENVADLFEKYKFDALIIVGGFEAFVALSQLRKARDKFPSLCIPLVLLPAGISNNIPGTEWSIGSDTALNNLVAYCDTINQSASSSRRRVFVVETQGGRCGYLATIGGLAVGAMAVYTPEEGMHLDMLFSDIKHLTHYFGKEHGESRGGRIVLINEKASNVYNAEMISHIIEDEARGRFSSRFATPGHFQQGNRPSGLDRCRAVRLAIKCIERLEAYGHCAHNKVKADPVSASVIGIQGSGVVFTPVQTLEEEDTNWKDRCSKSIPWMAHKEVVDSLGGRPTYPRR
jgi:6-phosphofructokinase 1